MKYLEPINLKQWLDKEGITETDLKNEVKETTSFKLSTELYKLQQRETPVTLNSIVAAILLSSQQDQMTMTDMLNLSTTMYLYIKMKRNATTFMQVKPAQALVEKHVEGLGFKLTNKGKKNSTILLTKAKANDYRLILALAHYSLRLSSVFVFE